MALKFQPNGNLIEGIHIMEFEAFEKVFGTNEHRKKLITGLKLGISHLKACGCKRVFVDGSFVTTKELPGDFDSCWDEDGVDVLKLITDYKTIVDFREERKYQKQLYYGEFFPMSQNGDPYNTFLEFFQKDRDSNKKGIVQINLT